MELNNILSHSERQTKHDQQQTEGKRQNGKETRGCMSTATEMERELTDKQRERERGLCTNRLMSSCGTVCILRT